MSVCFSFALSYYVASTSDKRAVSVYTSTGNLTSETIVACLKFFVLARTIALINDNNRRRVVSGSCSVYSSGDDSFDCPPPVPGQLPGSDELTDRGVRRCHARWLLHFADWRKIAITRRTVYYAVRRLIAARSSSLPTSLVSSITYVM